MDIYRKNRPRMDLSKPIGSGFSPTGINQERSDENSPERKRINFKALNRNVSSPERINPLAINQNGLRSEKNTSPRLSNNMPLSERTSPSQFKRISPEPKKFGLGWFKRKSSKVGASAKSSLSAKIQEIKNVNKKGLAIIAFFVATIIIFVVVFVKMELKKDQTELDRLLKKSVPKSAAIPMESSSGQTQAQTQTQQPQQAAASQSSPSAMSQETLPTPEETESPAEENKEETLKYENLGVSFEYPKDYKIEERSGQIVAVKGGDQWRMKIYSNKDKKETEEWFKEYFPEKDNDGCEFSDASLNIGSYSTKLAKIKSDADDLDCKDGGYLAQNDKKTKIARVKLEKASEEEARKILEKVKFIN